MIVVTDSVIANFYITLRQSRACHSAAVKKRILSNALNAFRDSYAFELSTTLKSGFTYTFNAVRANYAFKLFTFVKRIFIYTRDGVRQRYACFAARESHEFCHVLIIHNTVYRGIVTVVGINIYAFKIGFKPRLECILTNARNIAGNSYAFKLSAVCKRKISDACDTVGEVYACQTAKFKRISSNARNTLRDGYICNAVTIGSKCVVSDACNTFFNNNSFYGFAVTLPDI